MNDSQACCHEHEWRAMLMYVDSGSVLVNHLAEVRTQELLTGVDGVGVVVACAGNDGSVGARSDGL